MTIFKRVFARKGNGKIMDKETLGTTKVKNKISDYFQDVVDRFENLTKNLPFPEQLAVKNGRRTGQEFDVMQYFTVLTSLSLAGGYVLDYIYNWNPWGSRPILYVRKNTEERLVDYLDYLGMSNCYEYLNHVHLENTEQGYFQFALLRLLGGKFYLTWHANYFDTIIICNEDALNNVLEKYLFMQNRHEDVIQKAKEIHVAPQVIIEEKWATVKLLTFSKWGGLFRQHMFIRRNYPHEIDLKQPENLGYYPDVWITF